MPHVTMRESFYVVTLTDFSGTDGVTIEGYVITINVSGQEFLVSRTIIKGYPKTKLAKGLTNFECLNGHDQITILFFNYLGR